MDIPISTLMPRVMFHTTKHKNCKSKRLFCTSENLILNLVYYTWSEEDSNFSIIVYKLPALDVDCLQMHQDNARQERAYTSRYSTPHRQPSHMHSKAGQRERLYPRRDHDSAYGKRAFQNYCHIEPILWQMSPRRASINLCCCQRVSFKNCTRRYISAITSATWYKSFWGLSSTWKNCKTNIIWMRKRSWWLIIRHWKFIYIQVLVPFRGTSHLLLAMLTSK